jgi:hypothetical protein
MDYTAIPSQGSAYSPLTAPATTTETPSHTCAPECAQALTTTETTPLVSARHRPAQVGPIARTTPRYAWPPASTTTAY